MDYQIPWFEIIWSIVGGIITSIIYSIISDRFRKPRLKIDVVESDPAIDRGIGFYHLKTTNIGRTTATNCHLTIEYKNEELEHIITLNPGKWDDNPEPIMPVITGYNFVEPPIENIFYGALLQFIGKTDLRAKEVKTFCFLIKYDGDAYCYGFNADNYRNSDLKVQDGRKLGPGRFIITVVIEGDNVKTQNSFLLNNGGEKFKDLRIGPW